MWGGLSPRQDSRLGHHRPVLGLFKLSICVGKASKHPE